MKKGQGGIFVKVIHEENPRKRAKGNQFSSGFCFIPFS